MDGNVIFQVIGLFGLSVMTLYGIREFPIEKLEVGSSVLVIKRKNLRSAFYAVWFGVLAILLVIFPTVNLVSPIFECYIFIEWVAVWGGFNSFYPQYVLKAKSEDNHSEKE